ncbi:dihydrolipoyl dehydrogenase family protein [Leifsonia soli]|uniref:Pyruvate/2-oxoglutarate dehydrogenase complex dihydrolipoamide dehydrogenase (E3) component n=1 Tax=Leifsonia soli TaxID=582665 RepID=A0A852T6F7_9MICO|nr:FAD-dependent oxidoreductase [Leifsonia soli]NYD76114.1 pyruvate/2-oxoglutarate dehydrogenase complex dihydrolipoamide dehydrogenase (E3) component [Leifsonia soli]
MDTTTSLTADVIVLGFGKGGKTAAHALSNAGKRIILIEQSEDMYGGTCPNVGCIPTKMLVHYSNSRRLEDAAQEFFANSIEGVRKLTSAGRAANFKALDSKDLATVITGKARFIDPHTVAVGEGKDTITVTGSTILINTGSEPIVPRIDGIDDSEHLVSSSDLTRLQKLPENLVIIGGGYLGLEFASIYRHFGSEVTVLEAADRLLPKEDEDVASVAAEILAGDGITLIPGSFATSIEDVDGGTIVTYMKDGVSHTVRGDAVLPATGRKPATDGLNLEAAGVAVTPRGAVVVDEHLRTAQPHIFALGDVNGGPQFTYISLDDARIVIDQLLGDGKRSVKDRVAVPKTVFITPPLATVGLTEREARARGLNIKVARENVANIVALRRTYTVEETRGVMKFILDADTDQILGAAILSIDAQEVINMISLAMQQGVTATALTNGIYTHPSTTEAFNEIFTKIVS